MDNAKLSAVMDKNQVLVTLDCDTPEALALVAALVKVISQRAHIQTDAIVECLSQTIEDGNNIDVKQVAVQ